MELPLISYALYLLLYDTNQSKNPYFPYWNYQKNLERLNDAECKAEFRFIKNDIYNLKEVLNVPDVFICSNGLHVDGV